MSYGNYVPSVRGRLPSGPRRPVKVIEYKNGAPGLVQDFETREAARTWGRIRQGRGLNDRYKIVEYGREIGIFENGD